MAKKILIVDDEPDQIEMLKMRLESAGYEVISAQDGGEGLKACRAQKPDLVLLDLVMPNIDGMTVCKCLKGDPQTSHIPVIIITAFGLKEIERQSIECGADGISGKPYEASELLQNIKELLGG